MELDKVKELKKHGNLIPLVGAGLSANLGVPTGDGLVDLMADDLNWNRELFRLAGDLHQLAEFHVAVNNDKIGHLRSLLDKKFNRTDDEIKKSITHRELTRCKFPIIYTTNYDDFIERSIEIHTKKKPKVITSLSDLSQINETDKIVVKFHGTFKDDESLVLTEESYFERLEFESALDIRLRSDLLGKTMLFIGYSYSDINIRYMIYKLNRLKTKLKINSPTAIMAVYSPDDVMRRISTRRNVELVELDASNKEKSLTEFLRYIR